MSARRRVRATAGRRATVLVVAAGAVALGGCGGSGTEQEHGDASGSTAQHAPTATVPRQTSRAGLVDRAFVAQMVPHHALAVDMAREAPERAEHAAVRGLARAIVADQERELRALRAAAKRLGVTPAAMPAMGDGHAGHTAQATLEADAKTLGIPADALGMAMHGPDLRTAKPFDRAFLDAMVPHHEGAIRMARAELRTGEDAELRGLATRIVAAQTREVRRMRAWRTRWYGGA